MHRLRDQEGSTLILLIGITATLAIVAVTLVTAMTNVQGGTQNDRQKTQTFDIAEAGMDNAIYSLSAAWPTSSGQFAMDYTAFRNSFSTTDFPNPPAGKQFLALSLYDNAPYTNPYSASNPPTYDANGDGKLWVESQANVGTKSSRVRTLVEKDSISMSAVVPGVALYSGSNVTMTGSSSVVGPTQNGAYTASLMVGGNLDTTGGNPAITAAVYCGGTYSTLGWQTLPALSGTTVPPLSTYFPPSTVNSLTAASQIAYNTGTVITPSGTGWTSSPWGVTYASAVRVNGNLHIGTQGTYNFTTLYVTGNLTIDGNTTTNCTGLYVGGTLTVGGGAHTQTFGPTYVAGDVNCSGNQHFDFPLLVTAGNYTLGGTQYVGGDGVGSDADPSMVLMVGSGKTANLTGQAELTGALVNMGGGATLTGGGSWDVVRGALFTSGAVSMSGNTKVEYDPTVINNLSGGSSTVAKLVPDTWQEIKPQ